MPFLQLIAKPVEGSIGASLLNAGRLRLKRDDGGITTPSSTVGSGVGGVLAVACENPRCPEQQPSNLLFQMIFQKMRLRASKDPQHSTRPKAGWQYS